MNKTTSYVPQGADDENVLIDEETEMEFYELAQELRLSEEQAQGIWNWILEGAKEFADELNACAEKYVENTECELREMFGRDFDKKQKNAAKLIQKYGGDEMISFMNKTGIGNCREVVAFLMRLADAAGEDRGLAGEKAVEITSRERLKAEIAKMMADPAYMQAQHPAHDKTVQAVYQMRKRLFNEE